MDRKKAEVARVALASLLESIDAAEIETAPEARAFLAGALASLEVLLNDPAETTDQANPQPS